MSKLLKLLLNRVSIVAFLLLVQIFFIIIILKEASEFYGYIRLIFLLISIVYSIKILL